VRKPIIEWDYASREDELEAIRCYLTGRLDLQRKLDLRLGTIVNIYEYLRHAVKFPFPENPDLPNHGKVLQLPMKAIGACELIWPDLETGQWLKVSEFPTLPFTKLCESSRGVVLSFLEAQSPAFHVLDITELADWGLLDEFSELAEVSASSKERVPAEIEFSEGKSVFAIEVNFGAGVKAVDRFYERWKEENRHRFANARSLAGVRANAGCLLGLKDLAAARLLALQDYDPIEASQWAQTNQPRDPEKRRIPWVNKRKGKGRSLLFRNLRDWDRAVNRFGHNLHSFLVSQ
jgi:hypothetical protein